MNKKIFVIIAIVVSFGILIVGIRIISGEDEWTCNNGQWTKHGNPWASMPLEGCDSGVILPANSDNAQIIGGDKDEHGCLGSAGYSWCQAKEKCLRTWEEGCSIEDELKNYLRDNLSTLSPEPEVLGGKFYVTNLELTSPSTAMVEYEDGHIALQANFVFSYSDTGALQISNFQLVEE